MGTRQDYKKHNPSGDKNMAVTARREWNVCERKISSSLQYNEVIAYNV